VKSIARYRAARASLPVRPVRKRAARSTCEDTNIPLSMRLHAGPADSYLGLKPFPNERARQSHRKTEVVEPVEEDRRSRGHGRATSVSRPRPDDVWGEECKRQAHPHRAVGLGLSQTRLRIELAAWLLRWRRPQTRSIGTRRGTGEGPRPSHYTFWRAGALRCLAWAPAPSLGRGSPCSARVRSRERLPGRNPQSALQSRPGDTPHPEGCPNWAIAGVENSSRQVATAERRALHTHLMS
jgi:hypothetical protein